MTDELSTMLKDDTPINPNEYTPLELLKLLHRDLEALTVKINQDMSKLNDTINGKFDQHSSELSRQDERIQVLETYVIEERAKMKRSERISKIAAWIFGALFTAGSFVIAIIKIIQS